MIPGVGILYLDGVLPLANKPADTEIDPRNQYMTIEAHTSCIANNTLA